MSANDCLYDLWLYHAAQGMGRGKIVKVQPTYCSLLVTSVRTLQMQCKPAIQIEPRPSLCLVLTMSTPLKPSTLLPPGVVPSESRDDFEALVEAEANANGKDPKNLVKEVRA